MDWVGLLLIPIIKGLIILLLLLTGTAYLTLFERKLLGRFQIRYGPNRAGPYGLLQPLADAVKLFFKDGSVYDIPLMDKKELAHILMDRILDRIIQGE